MGRWLDLLDARTVFSLRNVTLPTRLMSCPGRAEWPQLTEGLARRAHPGPVLPRTRVGERGSSAGRALFVFDASCDPIALTVDLADLPVVIRHADPLRPGPLHPPAHAALGWLGRPPRHGARCLCADPTSGRPWTRRCRPTTNSRKGRTLWTRLCWSEPFSLVRRAA